MEKTVILEWFEMTISVVLIILAAILISMIIISLQKYKCPKCGAVIRPKWYHFSASLHMGSDRVVKCPHCGRKGFCRRVD